MKRLLLAATAALILAAPAAATPRSQAKDSTTTTSSAATTTESATTKLSPAALVVCRNKIINEWEGTGKIETTHPVECYRAALTFVSGHADLTEYSSLSDDVRLALQAALSRSHGHKVPLLVGKHYGKGGGLHSVGLTTTTNHKPPPNGKDSTLPTSAATGTGSGSGTPLPVLILGGLALALIAAGAIGTGVRYKRRHN